MIYFEILLLIVLILTASAVFFTKRNLTAIIIFTAFSLVMSIVWIIVKSPDLALIEAAVGAGVTSLLFFVALYSVGELKKKESPKRKNSSSYNFLAIILIAIIVILLLVNVNYLPMYGEETNPSVNEVFNRYVESGVEETGSINLVAAVILDYRAFDTFGEAVMIFSALVSVIMLLKNEREKTHEKNN